VKFPHKTSCWSRKTKCQKVLIIGVPSVIVVAAAVVIGVAVSQLLHRNSGVALPYVTPPVKQACPPALKSGNSRRLQLDPQSVRDRFFDSEGGPTNLFDILEGVDQRIQGINSRLSQFGCINSTTPVSYVLNTWSFQETFLAQCSEMWEGGNGFDQFALVDDVFYVYVRGGDGIVAAKMVLNSTGGAQEVDVWFTVGVINRDGSHGVGQLKALPNDNVFELSVAGSGLGFCGAQLKSADGLVNCTGSSDMGETCMATDSVCTAASNITEYETCTGEVNMFTLPALGRQAYGGGQFGASAYPGGLLNVVALSTTSPDDVLFGPSAPVV